MRMMIAASALALLVPAAALSDPPKPAVESAAARPGEALICQNMYYNGRIVGRAICKTEHAWIRARERQQAEVLAFQIKSLSAGGH